MEFWWGAGFWGIALPGYLTGAGTLALASVTFKTLSEGQRERRDRLDFQERADARRVVVDEPRLSGTGEGYTPGYINTTYVVVVTNNADEPIDRILVRLDVEPLSADAMSDNETLRQSLSHGRLMGRGAEWRAEFHVQLLHEKTSQVGWEVIPTLNMAAVAFTDSAGYGWLRTGQHRLILVKRPKPSEIGNDPHETTAPRTSWFRLHR